MGVPFAHQGRSRRGVDCVGLVIVVAKALAIEVMDRTDYGRLPRPDRMREALEEQLDRIAIGAVAHGDILWIAWRTPAQHLAFFAGETIIHGWEGVGKVVEHDFSPDWKARVRAAYRFRGIG